MGMSPGNQAITGGTVLRIPAMQSPNYVPGVSGWIVRQDGSAEFTTGTFRGSIEVGPLTGQHFVVNNTATGDPLDIYDSSNQLIFSVNRFGVAESHNPSNGLSAGLQSGQLEINDGAGNNDAVILLLPAGTTSAQTKLQLLASPPIGTSYSLYLIGGSDDGTKKPTTQGNERGVTGSLVQADTVSNNNLIHSDTYSGTTDANGHLIFNHGCGFTPKGAQITGRAPAVGTFPNLTLGTDGFTSTQANVSFIIANTNVVYANQSVMINATFFG